MITVGDAKERLEVAVLRELASAKTFGRFDTYSTLSRVTSPRLITRDIAGALLRDLTNRGLARFQSGLWTEDGEPAGSGYGITPKGLRYLCALEEIHQ